MGFDIPREQLDELKKLEDLRAGKASDHDLVTWVAGLIETLEMVCVTRAQGDEWIDPAYLDVLKARLSVG